MIEEAVSDRFPSTEQTEDSGGRRANDRTVPFRQWNSYVFQSLRDCNKFVFSRGLHATGPGSSIRLHPSVRDFLFIDAVSGKPLRREDKGFVARAEKRVRRSTLQAILVALIGVIISLVWWGFS